MIMKRAFAICLVSSTAWLVTTPALAQSDPSVAAKTLNESQIGDIIVTAQRRSERAQSTALAITAVGGKELQSAGIKDIRGLTQGIPNVQFGGLGGDAKIFIRGVGYDSISPGGETRVAVYSNNVYQSRSQTAFTTLYDLDRVEVLRGPQGTLYGRNAVAGAINIITADPGNHLNGYLSGQVGDYGLVQAEGAIGGPISENLSVRLAGQTVDRSGYGHNIGTGEPVNDDHSRSARLTVVGQLADNIRDRLVADYFNERDHNFGYRYIGPSLTPAEVAQVVAAGGNALAYVPYASVNDRIPTGAQDSAGLGPQNHLESYGVSNELSVEVSDLLNITAVTGYRHLKSQIADDIYGGVKTLQEQSLYENSNSFTQELRLSGDSGPFKYVIGGYYFNENHIADNRVYSSALLLPFGPFAGTDRFVQFFNAGGREKTNAYAAFGQADYKLFDALTLSAGLRYSYEKKHLDEFFALDVVTPYDTSVPLVPLPFPAGAFTRTQRVSYHSLDPRFTLTYQFNPRVIAYVTYSKGFKSGGFNIGGVQDPFKPERITDYEAGVKGDFLNGRLRANVAGFHYDYSNLQVNVVKGTNLLTLNAANAKVDGVEAELTALPTTDLRISLNAAWLNARYTSFKTVDNSRPELGELDLSGNRLNYAPKYKVGGTVAYTIASPYGEFTPTVDVTWTDKIFYTPYNTTLLVQPAHTNVDLSVRWTGKNSAWTGSVYVRNVTDKIYYSSGAIANPFVGYFHAGQPSAPRTFGVQITRHF
jgi:iron complex outermembrane receptor protein